MSARTYTLAQAAQARYDLINEVKALLHVAVLDVIQDGGEVGLALKDIAERKGGPLQGSHDLTPFHALAEAFVDRALFCPEDVCLELGSDYHVSEGEES